MEEISRVKLYTSVQNMLEKKEEGENYIDPFVEYLLNELGSFKKDLSILLKLNITILSGIEEKFLVNSDDTKFGEGEFKKIYLENFKIFRNEINFINDDNFNFLGMNNIYKLEKFCSNIDKFKDEFYKFSALIKLLAGINNNIIKKIKLHLNPYYCSRCCYRSFYKVNMNKVFLSYAFDDRLFALSLFFYLKRKGIFLYVDWIFSPEFKDGVHIKNNLLSHLNNCKQLLFLRTINSELGISNNRYIRGWCSWELGNFYNINGGTDKYYISLYRSKNKHRKNKQLDGMSPLNEIKYSKLV